MHLKEYIYDIEMKKARFRTEKRVFEQKVTPTKTTANILFQIRKRDASGLECYYRLLEEGLFHGSYL